MLHSHILEARNPNPVDDCDLLLLISPLSVLDNIDYGWRSRSRSSLENRRALGYRASGCAWIRKASPVADGHRIRRMIAWITGDEKRLKRIRWSNDELRTDSPLQCRCGRIGGCRIKQADRDALLDPRIRGAILLYEHSARYERAAHNHRNSPARRQSDRSHPHIHSHEITSI